MEGLVSTGMGDHLWWAYHPCQLSLLPSVGWKMSTGQGTNFICGCMCGKRVKLSDPSFTIAIPQHFRHKYRTRQKALYKCPVYFSHIMTINIAITYVLMTTFQFSFAACYERESFETNGSSSTQKLKLKSCSKNTSAKHKRLQSTQINNLLTQILDKLYLYTPTAILLKLPIEISSTNPDTFGKMGIPGTEICRIPFAIVISLVPFVTNNVGSWSSDNISGLMKTKACVTRKYQLFLNYHSINKLQNSVILPV